MWGFHGHFNKSLLKDGAGEDSWRADTHINSVEVVRFYVNIMDIKTVLPRTLFIHGTQVSLTAS